LIAEGLSMTHRTRIVLASIFMIVSTSQSVATDNLQRCSSIQDTKKRLECFDSGIKTPPEKKQRPSNEALARKATLNSLKDPDSAKFGKFTQVTQTTACLTVNARNAFGGYTGDQQAFLLKAENEWHVVAIEKDLGHSQCIEVMSKQSE